MSWWLGLSRDAWQIPKLKQPPKDVRNYLRWREEKEFADECRDLGMRPKRAYNAPQLWRDPK